MCFASSALGSCTKCAVSTAGGRGNLIWTMPRDGTARPGKSYAPLSALIAIGRIFICIWCASAAKPVTCRADALLHAIEFGGRVLVGGHGGSAAVGGDIRCERGESMGNSGEALTAGGQARRCRNCGEPNRSSMWRVSSARLRASLIRERRSGVFSLLIGSETALPHRSGTAPALRCGGFSSARGEHNPFAERLNGVNIIRGSQ